MSQNNTSPHQGLLKVGLQRLAFVDFALQSLWESLPLSLSYWGCWNQKVRKCLWFKWIIRLFQILVTRCLLLNTRLNVLFKMEGLSRRVDVNLTPNFVGNSIYVFEGVKTQFLEHYLGKVIGTVVRIGNIPLEAVSKPWTTGRQLQVDLDWHNVLLWLEGFCGLNLVTKTRT